MAPTAAAKASGEGSMWGRGLDASFTASMSKCTAFGICACAYSAFPSRLCVGRYQEASTTATSGRLMLAASHSVETKGVSVMQDL